MLRNTVKKWFCVHWFEPNEQYTYHDCIDGKIFQVTTERRVCSKCHYNETREIVVQKACPSENHL